MGSFRKLRVAAKATLVLSFALTACSKDEPKGASQKLAASASAEKPDPTVFQKTLVSYIPENSVGFFQWSGSSPAYEKLAKSPWGSHQNDLAKMIESSATGINVAKEIFGKAGINIDDPQTWKGLISEAAIFVAPGAGATKTGAMGAVFRPESSIKLADKFVVVKSELAKKGFEVQDVKLSTGSGFSFKEKNPAEGSESEKFFVGWTDSLGVLGSADWVLESVLSSKGDKLPTILSGPNYMKAAQGLPADKLRYATAYVDIQAMTAAADSFASAGAGPAAKLKSGDIPLKALSIALAMDETPLTSVRLVYDEAQKDKGWLKALNSSTSGELLAAVPSKPLLFLSLDGATIRQLKDIAAASAPPAATEAYTSELALFDTIKRIGISIRAGVPGQSMLPVPDVMIVVESSDAAGTQKKLQSVVGTLMASSGLPPMPWKDNKVKDVGIKSMITPFGVGVHLASTKNLVLISSTDSQLQTALAAEKGFATGLSAKTEQVFAKEESLGNLFVNFEEVATMMESMGGMLSMYAPKGAEGGEFLQAQSIEAMRKMGTVIGSVTLEDGAIGIDSFYQVNKPA